MTTAYVTLAKKRAALYLYFVNFNKNGEITQKIYGCRLEFNNDKLFFYRPWFFSNGCRLIPTEPGKQDGTVRPIIRRPR